MNTASEQAKEVFDALANEYAGHTYWRDDEDTVIDRYFLNRSGTLLIGCVGAGRTVPHLVKKGFKVTGVDIAPEMVRHCKETYGIDVEVMDIQHMTFADESFDYAFIPFNSIICVDDVQATVREFYRILKPGGVLVFNATNHFNVKGLFRADFLKPRRRPVRVMRTKAFTISGYHFAFSDARWIRSIFPRVKVIPRITMQNIERPNWKDRILQLLPYFDKSLYFVCFKD